MGEMPEAEATRWVSFLRTLGLPDELPDEEVDRVGEEIQPYADAIQRAVDDCAARVGELRG